MMFDLGHKVFLYAGEENEARCTELIPCIARNEQPKGIPEFSADSDLFIKFNGAVVRELECRIGPKDFICIIGGAAQEPIARAFPNHMTVEFGIGYGGVFSKYKVWESYAWMHTIYGALSGGNAHAVDGQFYDTVIPNYFEIDDFPFSADKDDYLLFMGRLIDRKGYRLAAEIAESTGHRLIIAGEGTPPDYGEYVGVVGPERRAELMSRASALIAPTLYIEPFGGVTAEAMLCGTPVITTDWGAFSENVIDGITGFRCRMFEDFCWAVGEAKRLIPEQIRAYAVNKFSTQAVAPLYENYFSRLSTLWGDGFYERSTD